MIYFKRWCHKFIKDNTPFGDIARDVYYGGRCVPDFKKKEQVLNFILQTDYWNDSAKRIIIEMLDIWEREESLPYLQRERKNIRYRVERIYKGNNIVLKQIMGDE